MSYDLTIWKHSAAGGDADTEVVLRAIGQDEAHPSMRRFAADAFVRDLQAQFGGPATWIGDDAVPPFHMEICDFTGTPANWIHVHMAFDEVKKALPKLVEVASRHGIVVYDWQTERIHAAR